MTPLRALVRIHLCPIHAKQLEAFLGEKRKFIFIDDTENEYCNICEAQNIESNAWMYGLLFVLIDQSQKFQT